MSTSVTQGAWEIVVIDQKELYSELRYWVVEVWQNLDMLGSNKPDLAECLFSVDNINYNYSQSTLTDDTLESLISKAVEFIKGQQK